MTQEETQSTTPQVQYVGDGVQTSFSFSFQMFNEGSLKVYLGSVLQQTGYTVQTDDEITGGAVVFSTAPASGVIITLTRELDLTRTTDFASGGVLRAADLNYEFDYQMGCLQQLSAGLSRSLLLPVFENKAGIDFSLPAPDAKPALVWNADGTALCCSNVDVGNLDTALQNMSETVSTLAAQAASSASASAQSAQSAASWAETAQNTLSGKANVDLSNVPSSKAILTSSWVASDYTGWYRTYSDGWIEQGGLLSSETSLSTAFNFYYPYSSRPYVFGIVGNTDLLTSDWFPQTVNFGSTLTQFNFRQENVGGFCYWYACGY